ncbi:MULTISPECIES: hypothetical protein [Acinetobacter]|uniref:Uncharacterized protein n=1 Tax=Acinetobacter higginsii TaxID=70347 RepID=N9R058_9GAMM|nr:MULTISPECIES: hypothetical protein [Acinetobacter]ENX51459.1 hypothetical protein F902_04336 [Acinetobacter higginsii]
MSRIDADEEYELSEYQKLFNEIENYEYELGPLLSDIMSYMYESNPLYGCSRRLRLGSFAFKGDYHEYILDEIDRFIRDSHYRPQQFTKLLDEAIVDQIFMLDEKLTMLNERLDKLDP